MKKFVKWLKYGCLVLVVSTQLLGVVSAADIDDPYKPNIVQPQNPLEQQIETVSN